MLLHLSLLFQKHAKPVKTLQRRCIFDVGLQRRRPIIVGIFSKTRFSQRKPDPWFSTSRGGD